MYYRRFDAADGFREIPASGERKTPCLDAYLLKDGAAPYKRKAVIICPGGGYRFTSVREGEPVAMKFTEHGIQTFILWYDVSPEVFPKALTELACTVRFVREHAEEWSIDPDEIYVMGFSAGGHLAASLSTMWHLEFLNGLCGSTPGEIRPNGSILCYPVITSGEKAHRGSFLKLCEGLPEEASAFNSLEERVDEHTPPTFIWTTWTDESVPAENTLLYVRALYEHGISCEAHIFKKGVHGLSLGTAETDKNPPGAYLEPAIKPWVQLCMNWLLSQHT